MAFPTVASVTASQQSTNNAVSTITTPATINAGDLLIAIVALDSGAGAGAWSTGWTEILDAAGTGFMANVAYRIATGTGDTNPTLTHTTERSNHLLVRITGWHGTTPPEITTLATGSSVNPNSASLTPSWGAADTLWISAAFSDDSVAHTYTGFPYASNNNQNATATSAAIVAMATTNTNAASVDPGNFTISASETWGAVTIAVRPTATTTISGSFTADANISKTGIAGTLTADANIKKFDIAGSATADAFIRKLDIGGALTADAFVSKTTASSIVADANIKATVTGSFTANAFVKATIGASTPTLVQSKQGQNLETLTFDSPTTAGNLLVLGSVQRDSGAGFTVPTGWSDSGAGIITTIPSNLRDVVAAYKLATGSETTVDAQWTSDNNRVNMFIAEFSGVDVGSISFLTQRPASAGASYTSGNFVLSGPALLLIALVLDTTSTGAIAPTSPSVEIADTALASNFAPAVWGAYRVISDAGTYAIDGTGPSAGWASITMAFNASGLKLTADAYIKKTLSGSFTGDAYVKSTVSGSVTSDAWIKGTVGGSLTADAHVRKNDIAGSFTADAYVSKTVVQSVTADAYVSNTVASSLTADAYLLKTLAASITADAFVFKTISSSFTADAFISKTLSGTFTTDAYIYATVPGSFVADSHIRRNDIGGSLTADAYIRQTIGGSITANAYVKATVLSQFPNYVMSLFPVGYWRLGEAAAVNVIRNASFENDFTSWGLGSGSQAIITGTSAHGNKFARIVGTGYEWISQALPVLKAGRTYTASIWLRTSGGATTTGGTGLVLEGIGQGASILLTSSLPTVWTRYSTTWTQIANASAPVVVVTNTYGGTSTGTFEFDAVQIEEASSASSFQLSDFVARDEVGSYNGTYFGNAGLGSLSLLRSDPNTAFAGEGLAANSARMVTGTLPAMSTWSVAYLELGAAVPVDYTAIFNVAGDDFVTARFLNNEIYYYDGVWTSTGVTLQVSEKAFFVWTYDGATLTLYKNGVSSYSASRGRAFASRAFWLGSWYSTGHDGSNDTFDELFILNRPMTSTEVTTASNDVLSGGLIADAYIFKTIAGSLTADANIKATIAGSLSADAYIRTTSIAPLTSDAYVRQTFAASLTADAYIRSTASGTFTADSFVFKTIAGAFSADAYVLNVSTGSWVADAHISKLGITGTYTADAHIVNRVAGSFTADAEIGAQVGTTFSGSFTASAHIKSTVTGSLSADAYVKQTIGGSLSADAYLRQTIDGSFSADAYVRSTSSGTLTANATVKRTFIGYRSVVRADGPLSYWRLGEPLSPARFYDPIAGSYGAINLMSADLSTWYDWSPLDVNGNIMWPMDAPAPGIYSIIVNGWPDALGVQYGSLALPSFVNLTTNNAVVQIYHVEGAGGVGSPGSTSTPGSLGMQVSGVVSLRRRITRDEMGVLNLTFQPPYEQPTPYPILGATGALSGDGDTAVQLTGGYVTSNYLNPTGSDSYLPQGGASRSVEFWVKTTSLVSSAIVSYGGVTGASPNFIVGVNNGYTAVSGYDGFSWVQGPTFVADGQWHHIVVAFSGPRNFVIYTDGVPSGILSTFADINTVPGIINIGGVWVGWDSLAGSIDEVAIYNYVLSDEQVETHWAAGVSDASTLSLTTDSYIRQTTASAITADGHIAKTISSTFISDAWVYNPNAVTRVNSNPSKGALLNTRQSKLVLVAGDTSIGSIITGRTSKNA